MGHNTSVGLDYIGGKLPLLSTQGDDSLGKRGFLEM